MKSLALLPLSLIALTFVGCDKTKHTETTAPASQSLSERAENAAEKTKDAAVDAKDAIAAKLNEWKLTPSDIKADLQNSGRVVRNKTVAAGEKVGGTIDNARLVTVINGKYLTDGDLSSRKINVDAKDGIVTLTGAVPSLELAGRALLLALDTDGVSQVVGVLTIEEPSM